MTRVMAAVARASPAQRASDFVAGRRWAVGQSAVRTRGDGEVAIWRRPVTDGGRCACVVRARARPLHKRRKEHGQCRGPSGADARRRRARLGVGWEDGRGVVGCDKRCATIQRRDGPGQVRARARAKCRKHGRGRDRGVYGQLLRDIVIGTIASCRDGEESFGRDGDGGGPSPRAHAGEHRHFCDTHARPCVRRRVVPAAWGAMTAWQGHTGQPSGWASAISLAQSCSV